MGAVYSGHLGWFHGLRSAESHERYAERVVRMSRREFRWYMAARVLALVGCAVGLVIAGILIVRLLEA